MRKIVGTQNILKRSIEIDKIRYSTDDENILNITGDIKSKIILDDIKDLTKGRYGCISIAQVVPSQDFHNIYLGIDNRCCDGAVLMYSLNKKEKRINFKDERFIPVPFNISGLLANENGQGIIYGSGCSGSGIRFFDFKNNSLEDVFSRDEKSSLSYSQYCLFFNPPQIEDGKFIVSYLDNNENLFIPSNEKEVPAAFMTRKILDTVVKRFDKDEKEAFEINIDDKMKGREEELRSIKRDVSNSSFIYNIPQLNWQTIAVVGEELSKYLVKHPYKLLINQFANN